MDFSTIHENPVLFFAWVTAIGMLISLVEATLKIKIEHYNNFKKRKRLIESLYPKKLA
tara:strand:- start:527 stop:700 length:174 start_codon:yes stop_codon:yes gene_type:complete